MIRIDITGGLVLHGTSPLLFREPQDTPGEDIYKHLL